MKIRTRKIYDRDFGNQWEEKVHNRWDYDDIKADPVWRREWISIDSALYDPDDDRVYLGITSLASDIFKAFDRKTETFLDLGYSAVADPFDAKFHRALVKGKDGCIYGAVALLHEVDKYWEAPGGAIVRYDPRSGDIRKLGIPLPHVYIQSMIIDHERDTAYCLCYPPEKLALFDLATGQGKDLGTIAGGGVFAQGENIVLDDAGCVWCNWAILRPWQYEPGPDAVRLCKYDPGQERVEFYRFGLPKPDGSYGTERAEAFFNFHDGFIYAGAANGSLYRLDPETGEARYLFTPTPERRSRLSSMVKAEDGIAYGVTGRDGNCELLRVDYRKDRFEKLGKIVDEEGAALHQAHDIVMTNDGVIFVAENDNPHRSSYLWEIEL